MSDLSVHDTVNPDSIVQITETIFKKWHRTGFISVGYWAKADRITIEVGSMDEAGALKSATKCFLEAPKFLAYLRSEISNNLLHIFPKFETDGFASFGGGRGKDKTVISRVFKSTYWKGKDGKPDLTARAFKCGHFKGTATAQGAVTPNYNEMISNDSMKISMEMLAEMYEKISSHRMIDTLLYQMDISPKVP